MIPDVVNPDANEFFASGTPTQNTYGALDLHFRTTYDDNGISQTVVDTHDQKPPLRIVRAFAQADGAALVHLHNISGGILGGDQLEVTARVGANARAQLTTTGATRVYRHRPGHPDAQQTTRFSIATGGLLEYLPDQLISYAGARYRQFNRFDLEGDAGLFAWDITSPGREARGERFHYEYLGLESQVTSNGEPVAYEKIDLKPAAHPLASPLGLGPFQTFATLLICRGRQQQTRWRSLEKQLAALAVQLTVQNEVVWGASALVADGVIVRGLACEGRKLIASLPHFWRLAKQELYGLEPILPRKIY